MKKIIILILLLFASASSSRAINRDSLMDVWNNKSLHDTVRMGAIYDLAWSYMKTNPDSAMILAQIHLEYAARGNYKIEQAYAYATQGSVFYNKENYLEAIKAFSMSLKFAEEIGNKKVMAYDYSRLASIYYQQGVYPKVLENYSAALKLHEEMNNKDAQADMYNNISIVYTQFDKDSIALEYYFKALKLRDPNNKLGLGKINMNIGISYMSLGDYTKAIQYFNTGKNLYEEVGYKEGLGFYYLNVGDLYQKKGDYQNAMINFRESLKIREELRKKEKLPIVYSRIGEINNLLKNYSQAVTFCEKALKLSKELGMIHMGSDACNCLYKAYKGLENITKAFEYYEQYIKLNDSLNEEEVIQKMQRIEFQKQLLADSLKQEEEKQKVELSHREQMHRQRNQKIILFSAIAVALVMIFSIWRRLRYTRKAKAEIEKAKGVIEKEKERSESLLLNILPSEVAEEIKQDGHSKARTFSMVTVMFTDFKDFTAVSEKYSAELLVAEIDHCFSTFDNIIQKYNIEKIKTVGDAYMCAGGMPVLTTTHAVDVVNAAIEIRNFMLDRKKEQDAKGGISFELRLGVHTGPVVAGIVGVKKYAYDIWGDTVNIAARMEQNSEAGKINISGSTYKLVKDKFNCVFRGKIEAKNKGEVEMFFVEK